MIKYYLVSFSHLERNVIRVYKEGYSYYFCNMNKEWIYIKRGHSKKIYLAQEVVEIPEHLALLWTTIE